LIVSFIKQNTSALYLISNTANTFFDI